MPKLVVNAVNNAVNNASDEIINLLILQFYIIHSKCIIMIRFQPEGGWNPNFS